MRTASEERKSSARRFVILGCLGAGKSRFAVALGQQLDLPVVHGDKLFWRPGWTDPDNDEFRADVLRQISTDRWIYDGNTGRVADIVLPRAETILWIEQPALLCVARAYGRSIRHLNRTRPDMGPDCPERLTLSTLSRIWNFDKALRPRIETWLHEYAPDTPVTRLNGDRAIAAFLREHS